MDAIVWTEDLLLMTIPLSTKARSTELWFEATENMQLFCVRAKWSLAPSASSALGGKFTFAVLVNVVFGRRMCLGEWRISPTHGVV